MMRLCLILSFVLITGSPSWGQELFPMNEPASNIPKGIWGIRITSDAFIDQEDQFKTMQGLKIMYGVNKNLMVWANLMFSNHHDKDLPSDFVQPKENEPGFFINNHIGHLGAFPYQFNGVHLYAKYRLLTFDQPNQHFRLAAYGEGFLSTTAHHLAEPHLMGYNSGTGAGMIATWLKKKLAISFTGGFILPQDYYRAQDDVRFEFGRALNYNLSFGYLLLPFQYTSYKQTNVNVYVEFMGRKYERANIFKGPERLESRWYPDLLKGNYVDVFPGIQFIFNS
ncbi:MAG: hypothetical protein AAF206_10805, partial [Bacteroidota bacterium]